MLDKGLFEQLNNENLCKYTYPSMESYKMVLLDISNDFYEKRCKGIINTDSPLFQLYLQANNNDWKEAIKQYRKKKYEQKCTNIVYKTK